MNTKRIIATLLAMSMIIGVSACGVEYTDPNAPATDATGGVIETTLPSSTTAPGTETVDYLSETEYVGEGETYTIDGMTADEMFELIKTFGTISDGDTINNFTDRFDVAPMAFEVDGGTPIIYEEPLESDETVAETIIDETDATNIDETDITEYVPVESVYDSSIIGDSYVWTFNYYGEFNSRIGVVSLVSVFENSDGSISLNPNSSIKVSFETSDYDMATELYDMVVEYLEDNGDTVYQDNRTTTDIGQNNWFTTVGDNELMLMGSETYYVTIQIPVISELTTDIEYSVPVGTVDATTAETTVEE